MALRKKGKYWHAYFLVKGKMVSKSTGQTDKDKARYLEDVLHSDIKNDRIAKRFGFTSTKALEQVTQAIQAKEKRIKLSDLYDIAVKYRELSRFHFNAINRFIKNTSVKYASEVTPRIALDYLQQNYGHGNGKSYNNARTYLNTIFKACLVETGMDTSPFESLLPMRIRDVEAHRRITNKEFEQLYSELREPWKTAALISWYTGLRKSDCFSLCWNDIDEDKQAIIKVPGKTSRYARAVYVPVHPRLWSRILELPRPESPEMPILGKVNLDNRSSCLHLAEVFGKLGDTADGKASFHSLRASFITRCDEAGIPRHALRGIVGHTSDTTTNMYSQDKQSAELIRSLSTEG